MSYITETRSIECNFSMDVDDAVMEFFDWMQTRDCDYAIDSTLQSMILCDTEGVDTPLDVWKQMREALIKGIKEKLAPILEEE